MLYKFDEYKSEYPYRVTNTLDFFANEAKNLHEMTAEEISDILAEKSQVNEKTAMAQNSIIRLYLKWLKENGVDCDPKVVDDIKRKYTKRQYSIYSTKDLADYYDILLDCLEQHEKSGTTLSPVIFMMSHAASILAFYGLTDEQIIALDLADVQEDGVNGYDLPLTREDIKNLLNYKYVSAVNGRSFTTSKYIRSSRRNTIITPEYLNRPIWKLKLDEDYDYLKALLRLSNVRDLGMFNRVYEKEKATGVRIERNKSTPQWYIDILGLSGNTSTLARSKNTYIEYREERTRTEKQVVEKPKAVVAEPKQGDAEIQTTLNRITAMWAELGREIEKLQDLIKR